MEGPKQSSLAVPIAIVIAGIIVGGAIIFGNKIPVGNQGAEKPTAKPAEVGEMRPISSSDHMLGNPSAPVVIVEYSDTECPFCKVFHRTMKIILNDYGKTGSVAWVYRHFPIPELHPKAKHEAEATECAWEIGGNTKFFEYLDRIFTITPSNNGLDPAELPVIAEEIGLDKAKFNACLASGKYAAKIENDVADALKAGARGTPHSIIITKDGTKIPIEGAQPYEIVKAMIDSALAEIK